MKSGTKLVSFKAGVWRGRSHLNLNPQQKQKSANRL
jgi:hypothetical protein